MFTMQTDEEPIDVVLGGTASHTVHKIDGEANTKKAFSKISRVLSEDDLKSPGTQRLLLGEIDQFEECKKQLDKYKDLYYKKDADCKVYQEKLKSNATLEVASGSLLAIGPALMSMSISVVDKNGEWYYISTILLVIGVIMLLCGIITKILKQYL